MRPSAAGRRREGVGRGRRRLDFPPRLRPPRGRDPKKNQKDKEEPTTRTRPQSLRPGQAAGASAGRLVDQQEAAALAGCSRDTIARARKAGRLPHSRLHAGRWLVAVDDLAEAGLLVAVGPERAEAGEEDPVRATSGAAVVLARAEARLCALEDLVTRQDDELRFLRQLAADLGKAS